MKENGKKIREMDKEFLDMKTGIYMKCNFKIIKNKELVF